MNLAGTRVVVTGKVAGESRQTAEQKLREAGALVQSAVTKDTDLLVTGDKVGAAKIGKAAALGVTIVSWAQAWQAEPVVRVTVPVEQRVAERRAAAVRQIGPMLAKKGELPTGPGWSYEVKWDGYRCVATVRDGRVTMQSRSGKSEYAEQFPAVAGELAKLPDCVLDGEVCVVDDALRTSMASLSGPQAAGAKFVVFDLLERDGLGDLRALPYVERRRLLGELLGPDSGVTRIAQSPVWPDGEQLLATCRELGLEGVVAKRNDSRYVEGSRRGEWVKVKVRNEQEFVVVGWTPGEGAREGLIGALVLAVNDEDGRLVYAGRAGSGINGNSARLFETFTPRATSPLAETPRLDSGVRWVEPEVVVQIAFQRWTEDGRLWHPSFQGVRTDKRPDEVVREW